MAEVIAKLVSTKTSSDFTTTKAKIERDVVHDLPRKTFDDTLKYPLFLFHSKTIKMST